MQKFAINYDNLEKNLNKKITYKLSDVQHKLKKVAFDVVRFVDNDIEGLWRIENGENDDKYIVALYDEAIKTASIKSKTNWKTLSASDGTINIFYNNKPITKLSLASFGISNEEAYLVHNYLPEKLANNEEFRNTFITTLSEPERETLLKELGQ